MEDDALDGVSNAEALERIAFMVDHAADTQDGHRIDRALRVSERLSAREDPITSCGEWARSGANQSPTFANLSRIRRQERVFRARDGRA